MFYNIKQIVQWVEFPGKHVLTKIQAAHQKLSKKSHSNLSKSFWELVWKIPPLSFFASAKIISRISVTTYRKLSTHAILEETIIIWSRFFFDKYMQGRMWPNQNDKSSFQSFARNLSCQGARLSASWGKKIEGGAFSWEPIRPNREGWSYGESSLLFCHHSPLLQYLCKSKNPGSQLEREDKNPSSHIMKDGKSCPLSSATLLDECNSRHASRVSHFGFKTFQIFRIVSDSVLEKKLV